MKVPPIALVLGLLLVGHIGLSATMFCYHEFRWLSDRELVQRAIRQRADAVTDQGVREALLELGSSERCCVVARHSNGRTSESPIDKALRVLLGQSIASVELGQWNGGDPDFILVTACGREVDSD